MHEEFYRSVRHGGVTGLRIVGLLKGGRYRGLYMYQQGTVTFISDSARLNTLD